MSAQQHGFKAEVQQLLDLMIHSVYSNRDVFLRELLSNAADALDKVNFLQLTESGLSPAAHDTLGIRLEIDEEAGTLTLTDDGIGMTAEEAIEHLGTIAHSGTKAFFEKMKESGGEQLPELIGQFGVGFYSSFMVADEVIVETRSARAEAAGVRWVSQGAGSYTVEDIDLTHRGTKIILKLREDAMEYASADKLRTIVREHSNFLSWPILLGDDQLNSGKAVWLKRPSEVTDEEANEFYRSLAFDFDDPLLRVHFQVDTPLQYAAMLFIPKHRPHDLFLPNAERALRLYARRVLISDNAKELLPDWLRFVRGAVDSEDISLNVSREMVQQTPVVRKIKDALVKRVLRELGKLAKKTPEEGEDNPYHQFWSAFGVLLKEGYYHDRSSYGDRLLPLLRFNALSHEDGSGLMSLAEYKAAMPEGQDTIWYLTAESREAALTSPHLEILKKKGWDALILTDTVDEWLMSALTEFEEVGLKSVARGELSLDEEDDGSEKADLDALGPWMTSLFDGEVASVRASTRLTDSPAVLVDDEHGVSSNMERILREAHQENMNATRHLELNVKHPLVKNLVTLHERGQEDTAAPLARLLLDDALLMEGTVKDAAAMGKRLQALLERAAAQAVQNG